MRIGYFDAKEFASRDGAKSPYGAMNVSFELVDLCNRIREEFGRPIYVSSGYRSPEWNAHEGGVPNSTHAKGEAADLHDLAESPEHIARLWQIADRLNPDGGVGLYDWGVHVDVRGTRARWDYRTTGD